jgi:hypothetical protein
MIRHFFLVLVILGILLDVASLYLGITRNNKGHGPSGIPIVSLITYFIYFGYLSDKDSLSRIEYFILLTLFHVLCQFVIPRVHLWYRGRNDSRAS